MMRIINSRLYQGLIPVTNYMILAAFSMIGLVTVFLAYPIMSASVTTAIRIYGRGNEVITKKYWMELKRHFWAKFVVGLFVSTSSILFYFIFTDTIKSVIMPIRVSLAVSLVLFVAFVFFMILEEFSMRHNYQIKKFFSNAVLDLVTDFPYALVFAFLVAIIVVLAMLIPLSTYFTLLFLNLIIAAMYHHGLQNKLSRF
ncbi:hypothetical protein J5F27_14340 [Schleiferilactobacillus harbinensis]|uniref:hypothetical protein n=1 Tax=Schleiferilactobacillus harbinensis TaxID=304207 RepID=UPI001AAEEEFC|nr:hypothetical protein [Schleiferilactobacillus harbinensis]MBO3093086.1 hypothetical protein [Schleiferilactobacillus harbinensis]